MRLIVIVVCLVLLMVFAGWLVFDFSGNRASVEVRSDRIESDTKTAVDRAGTMLERAEQNVHESLENR